MIDHAVVIAGGGPTGLMLAAELALAGVDVVVIERRPTQELAGSRAGGLHARTIEILDQRGIAARFLAQGQIAQVAGFASIRLDIGDFPTRHPYGLGLWQNHIERILAEWVAELRVPIRRATDLTDFTQDADGVTVTLSDGATLRTAWLVGCDGGRSRVRKVAGIGFPGWEATTSNLIAEVEMSGRPELGMRRDAGGMHGISRVEYEIRDGAIVYADAGPMRVMLTERAVGATAEPTLEDLSAGLVSVYGTDYGVHSPTWISRFTDATRQAATYRDRRVLLAGDAAHIHYPVGGQGLNLGMHDAVNLGWKLALVAGGKAPPDLLDTYHAERHPVAARVLRSTMAQVALLRADDRTAALRDTMAELLAMEEPRTRMAAEMSGLGIRYDVGDGHPLLGRRMPDLDMVVDGEATRVYALLHRAEALLIDFGPSRRLDVAAWSDRVRRIDGRCDVDWVLPVIGVVAAPPAVLVRPDGHVAWVDDGSGDGLEAALTRWFGPPAPPRRS